MLNFLTENAIPILLSLNTIAAGINLIYVQSIVRNLSIVHQVTIAQNQKKEEE